MKLTSSEWYVMECLWESAPKTLMQLVEELGERVGWAKSTCTTMVRRMDDKGLICHEEEGRTKYFYPVVQRSEATKKETKEFLQRIYHGSVGMMVSAMAENKDLTEEDLEELEEIVKQWKKK